MCPAQGRLGLAYIPLGHPDYVNELSRGLVMRLATSFLPALDVKILGDPERFVDSFTSQHYALGYGDFRKELRALAKLLEVEAVEI